VHKDNLPRYGLPASTALYPQTGKNGWESDCEIWQNAQQRPLSMRVWRDMEQDRLDFWLQHDEKHVSSFYDRLRAGDLVAFGVPEPMPPSGGYVEIHPSRWAVLRIPDWRESTASGGGAAYHLCLFYRRADVDAWRAENDGEKEAVAKRRRTLKEIVGEAMTQADLSDPGWRTRRGGRTTLARNIASQTGSKLESILATMRKVQ
jgi:hypothetical protein